MIPKSDVFHAQNNLFVPCKKSLENDNDHHKTTKTGKILTFMLVTFDTIGLESK